jgi:hypothetical protein
MSDSLSPIVPAPAPRTLLRDLPLACRLTLALFLISVGLGYVSALVNLHFQSATPGKTLPDDSDVVADYHGTSGVSQLERLLVAHPSLPRNGAGSMRRFLTRDGIGPGACKTLCKDKAKQIKKEKKENLDPDKPEDAAKLNHAVADDLEGERLVLVAWVHDGAAPDPYENDSLPLVGKLAGLAVTPRFVDVDENKQRSAKIKSIFEARCTRCHNETAGGSAGQYPLESYEDIKLYTDVEAPTGKSLAKLALTTHVHLLGFSMLYGLTGVILAFSSYSRWLRVVLCPLPLAAQVVDIGFWWLARLDPPYGPLFASAIIYSGGVVALGLGLQILLGLFDLFSKKGKLALLLLAVIALGGAYLAKERLIDPYLAQERGSATLPREGRSSEPGQ